MQREKSQMDVEAYAKKMEEKRLTMEGREVPSSVPMAAPIGFVRQPSLIESIRNMVRSEQLRAAAEKAGAETFEEADDFDVDDDLEPVSRYEYDEHFEPAVPSLDVPTGGSPPPGEGEGARGSASEPPADAAAPEASAEGQEQGKASPASPSRAPAKPAARPR